MGALLIHRKMMSRREEVWPDENLKIPVAWMCRKCGEHVERAAFGARNVVQQVAFLTLWKKRHRKGTNSHDGGPQRGMIVRESRT